MTRFFIVILLTLSASFSAHAQGMRAVNQVTIAALIITSGAQTPVSSSVTHTLEALDAQVLTANAPNASQMRSILKRFAAAAIDVDVALVYYDGAVLKLGDREFVAPGGITLRRPSDLLTKAIPLSALARATALAANGGAVLVHSTGEGVELIDGVRLVETAPNARTGTSPILFAASAAALNVANALKAMADTSEDISLNDALNGLAALSGVSMSQPPMGHAMLRRLPAPETPAEDMATSAETTPDEAPMAETTDAETTAPVEVPDVPADVPEAATEAPAEDVAEDTAPVAMAPTDVADETPAPTADAELSLEVLTAMQGALTRGQKRSVQQHLRGMGFYRGFVDGIFGPQTARAIAAYQESISAPATGVLTPIQLEALSE